MANKDMEGRKAPAFKLKDQDGETWQLKDFAGAPLVLYFYPKDDTTGCTKEACAFRDQFPEFEGIDAQIVGVSPDTVESHAKFAQKYELPFTLLADPDHKVAEKYDVWQEKNMYGKRFFGVTRAVPHRRRRRDPEGLGEGQGGWARRPSAGGVGGVGGRLRVKRTADRRHELAEIIEV